MPRSDDEFSDDPFFGPDAPDLYAGEEHINAWEIDEQAEWLLEHGFDTGDPIRLTWRDADGTVTQTEIPLPRGDWDKQETWSDFYDEMREFFEDLWGDNAYAGEATAG